MNLRMRQRRRPWVVTLLALTVTGCSNRALYDSIQVSNRTECGKLPQAEFEECMARNEKPYGEYERELEEGEQPSAVDEQP